MYSVIVAKQGTPGAGDERLLEEIGLLEDRLRAMGLDGDCAYERSISRLYHELIEGCRQRLSAFAGY